MPLASRNRMLNFGTDYHAAGENLLASNIRTYNDLDCIHIHPVSKAKVYIGNLVAAQTLKILEPKGITRVVNCQDPTTENYHERNGRFRYYRFPISHWWKEPNMDKAEKVLELFAKPFIWIDQQLEQGHSVLIHCLAGAHRAGSTGVGYYMYVNRLGFDTALTRVKSIRPIVDPFGPLEELLRRLEVSLRMAAKNGDCVKSKDKGSDRNGNGSERNGDNGLFARNERSFNSTTSTPGSGSASSSASMGNQYRRSLGANNGNGLASSGILGGSLGGTTGLLGGSPTLCGNPLGGIIRNPAFGSGNSLRQNTSGSNGSLSSMAGQMGVEKQLSGEGRPKKPISRALPSGSYRN